MTRRSWWGVLKRTVQEYQRDNLSDWAAALTYYAILSLFPGLLVLVAGLGLFGSSTVDTVVNNLTQVAPGATRQIITDAVRNIKNGGHNTAGILAIVSLVAALWSASGYVAAFMRAANAIYDVPEGRPLWKKLPVRLGVTIVTGVLLAISAFAVVLTGRLAEQVGKLLGIGGVAVQVWNIAKWPVLALIVSLVFAILYWAAPNARQGGFRWVSPGGLVAVVIWLLGSAGFALYVAKFGSYNKTYGALAAIIIFLVWLYLTNTAVLLGAELNAELERGRALEAGHPAEAEPYTELRDDRKVDTDQAQGLG
ncbi:MAG: ribonuclease [Actinobacteria bacterium 13_2_20CM_2_71_6]|nr:MAG: ribonuclease [Actinobacteria bacterium 13_2_20CM_2_71_6]